MIEKLEIKTHLLDLVMRDNDFVIYHGDTPITTPQRKELASPTSRILKQLLLELSINPELNLRSINTYSLLSYQLDFLGEGKDPLFEYFELIAEKDPFIQLKDGSKKQSQVFDPARANVLFENHPAMLPVIFWGVSGMLESFNNFLSHPDSLLAQQSIQTERKTNALLRNVYAKLEKYEKTVVNVLSFVHNQELCYPFFWSAGI